jgi:hypothetical protein
MTSVWKLEAPVLLRQRQWGQSSTQQLVFKSAYLLKHTQDNDKVHSQGLHSIDQISSCFDSYNKLGGCAQTFSTKQLGTDIESNIYYFKATLQDSGRVQDNKRYIKSCYQDYNSLGGLIHQAIT